MIIDESPAVIFSSLFHKLSLFDLLQNYSLLITSCDTGCAVLELRYVSTF